MAWVTVAEMARRGYILEVAPFRLLSARLWDVEKAFSSQMIPNFMGWNHVHEAIY